MLILAKALEELGAVIRWPEKKGFLPVHITGRELHGGRLNIEAGESSQHISGLAMIGPFLDEGLVIELKGDTVSLPYLDMTLSMLRTAGIDAGRSGDTVKIRPGGIKQVSMEAEPDWSAAAFIFALAAATEGSCFVLRKLKEESIQGDRAALQYFGQLGLKSVQLPEGLKVWMERSGLSEFSFDLRHQPDLLPPLAVSAAALQKHVVFTGLHHLTIKESDRLRSMSEGLSILGVNCAYTRDTFEVRPSLIRNERVRINAHNDHRIAMAFAMLTPVSGPLIISDHACVEKSWPSFWRVLEGLGFGVEK